MVKVKRLIGGVKRKTFSFGHSTAAGKSDRLKRLRIRMLLGMKPIKLCLNIFLERATFNSLSSDNS